MRRIFVLVAKAWLLYRANGIEVLARRVWRYVRRRGIRGILLDLDNSERFQRWLRVHAPSQEELNRMGVEALSLTYAPMIDVIMPVCDPELPWLEAAVRSVRDQVYPHWHLCIADDASRRPEIRNYLDRIASEEPRVSLVRQEVRGGISVASNAALDLATGEFACFLDHDDELSPHALYQIVKALNENSTLDLIYSDECALESDGRLTDPHFKPSFSPDLLMSMNYIGHLTTCRVSLLRQLGGFRSGFDGSQDYDLLLRLTEITDQIRHVPDILYHWRRTRDSTSGNIGAKPYAFVAASKALTEAAQRRGFPAQVTMGTPGRFRVRYAVRHTPFVSILIPTRNRRDLLERCLSSIREKTTYQPYEILVLDNESDEASSRRYLRELEKSDAVRVIAARGAFNWSAINNIGAKSALGEHLVFLNNDTEILTPEWLAEIVAQGQRPQVGAVGAKLLFPDGRIQHAGVVVGMGGVAGHAFYGHDDDRQSYFDWTESVRNVSAVTGACMLTRRSVFEALGGFREDLKVSYNDVDYCLRLGVHGYTVVWTPHAVLRHYESASRRRLQPREDERLFLDAWHDLVDPYVSPNLDVDDVLFRIKVSEIGRRQDSH